MDLKEVGWEDVDWFKLTKERFQWRAVVNTVINLRVSIKCGELLDELKTG